MTVIAESVVEEALLEWLADLGYEVRRGIEIAPGEPAAERDDYREALLLGRLRAALVRINPGAPTPAIEEAVRVLQRTTSPALAAENRAVHRLLVDGVSVDVHDPEAGVRGRLVKLIDYDDPVPTTGSPSTSSPSWIGPSVVPTCCSSSTGSPSRTSS